VQIKNFDKAVKRIKKAIASKERIILYGDFDLDGVTSLIILKTSIELLKGKVTDIYFPNTSKDGYGLNKKALKKLKKHSPALLITLDCGIGNSIEVKIANKLGFEVIIIDHHKVLELPNASIIIDPKQPDDPYPFKELANVGIVYKFVKDLLGEKMSPVLSNSFLELVAIGSISDMVPEKDENKEMIDRGVELIDQGSSFQGIAAFFEIFSDEFDSTRCIIQKMNSAINAGTGQGYANQMYIILTIKDPKTALIFAKILVKKSYIKNKRIEKIFNKIKKRVRANKNRPVIVEGDKNWRPGFLGTCASKIANEYKKPTFIYGKGKNESIGSARTPSGFDMVDAMKNCSHLLIKFGGHPMAAGFRLKNENIEQFEICLESYFLNKNKDIHPSLN
jgi:single-stranded-DNA-specific exonuclease